jgi:hypothetical protein
MLASTSIPAIIAEEIPPAKQAGQGSLSAHRRNDRAKKAGVL